MICSKIGKGQGMPSKSLAQGDAGRGSCLAPQETVPCTSVEAGGTTPVPIPTSMASGTAVATTEAATRMAFTGLSSAVGRTRSRRLPCSSGPPGCDCPSVLVVLGDPATPPSWLSAEPVLVFPTVVDPVPRPPQKRGPGAPLPRSQARMPRLPRAFTCGAELGFASHTVPQGRAALTCGARPPPRPPPPRPPPSGPPG